jgi:hypothetical protein
LLAGFLKADQSLLDSDDPALRMSFYTRFYPSQFKDWPAFLNKDGSEFVQAALENVSLWRYASERERLSQVCWDCPDPHSDMDRPNDFRALEKRHREHNPEWFAEKEVTNDATEQDFREIREKLYEVAELLREAIQKKRGLFG